MEIELELFSWAVADAVKKAIRYETIDVDLAIHTAALDAIKEIQKVLKDETIEDDFEVVEEIVCIFEKYQISAGGRHDFG